MPPAAPDASRPERLDPRALQRAWRRLAAAPEPPWLHGEVARRMGERLSIVRQVPRHLVEWGASIGASEAVLRAACPDAERVRVAHPCDAAPAPSAGWRRLWTRAAKTQAEHDLEAGRANLLWSNMTLHWMLDVPAAMRAWHRALAVDGFLMFSTLGPGTLEPLRQAYARRGWGPSHAPWIDMHDLGDMLVEAGFADPVMDQETLRLSFSGASAALDELRGLGANLDRTRYAGLRTREWRHALLDVLAERSDAQGRVVLEFEVVYGHAFKALPRPRVTSRTEVGIDEMKLMLRRSGTSE